MLRRFFALLNSPFPDRKDLAGHVRETFYIALFITFFLFAFNPFRFQYLDIGRLGASLCFGAVTFLCSVSFDLFMRFVIKLKTDVPTWTLWKWLLVVSMAVVWVAIGNYAMLMLLEPHTFRWDVFFSMLINTFLVACMPVLAMGMAVQLQAERFNQRQAMRLVKERGFNSEHEEARDSTIKIAPLESQPTIEFEINTHEVLALEPQNIALIEAMQNYLTIHHRAGDEGNGHGGVVKSVVRSTMANAEALLENSNVIRCHRSFMVNLDDVDDVSGNAQGLKVGLSGIDNLTVPVSRRYIPTVKAGLARLS